MNVRTTPAEKKIRVFVADSSRIHTQLLARALESDQSFEVLHASANSQDIVPEVLQNRPDVAIVSSALGGNAARGFDFVREMRAAIPTLRVVMLLDSPVREMVLEAFRCGARGIFTRNESLETLRNCILCVHQGEVCARPEQMAYAVEALASAPMVRATDANGFSVLSKREVEVVQYLAEGLTNREIATRMGLSRHTVKNYLFKIFDKVGVTSRVELLFMTLTQAGAPSQRALSDSDGKPPNPNGAALYRKAAEDGFPSAQFRLAQMYSAGVSVPKDLVAAYTWYLVCEESTIALNKEVADQKRIVCALLSPEQLLEARTKARLYLQKLAKRLAKAVQSEVTRFVACMVCVLLVELVHVA